MTQLSFTTHPCLSSGRMSQKILILTAGFGEGHNTAAKNVRDALRASGDGTVQADVFDLFEICYGRFNEFTRRAYLMAINRTPRVWQKIYEMLDTTSLLEMNLPTLGKMRRHLRKMIEEEKPDMVVSTYPLYSFLLKQLFPHGSKRSFTFYTVVTDSITINSSLASRAERLLSGSK